MEAHEICGFKLNFEATLQELAKARKGLSLADQAKVELNPAKLGELQVVQALTLLDILETLREIRDAK